tara:strand:- start:29 stop:223 length:195 start_codon:yes stop_codon:yes gene_type:complete
MISSELHTCCIHFVEHLFIEFKVASEGISIVFEQIFDRDYFMLADRLQLFFKLVDVDVNLFSFG